MLEILALKPKRSYLERYVYHCCNKKGFLSVTLQIR